MLAVARNHRRVAAAATARTSSPCSTYGSSAVATSSKTDRQEREKKSTSTWMKIKLFLPPAFFFCAGTERLYSLREKAELAEQWKSRLKLDVVEGSEISEFSGESLKCMEFRKVKCRGVFDENKSILVLENVPTPSDPFAYEYSLLTPFIPLPTHPQSVTSPILVNRGRVPRDWADYRKIEKLQSHEIVRDFPQKHQPVESLGVTRSIMLRLKKHLIPSFLGPKPEPEHVEVVGIIRSGVYPGWFNMNIGTIVGAVGLDPNSTLYVEKIEDTSTSTSHESSIATPYTEDHMLSRFDTMRREHIQMIVIWYCCSGGTFYLARWLMRMLKNSLTKGM